MAQASALPVTTGTHSVLILLVDWAGQDSVTQASAENQVSSIDSAWYGENSHGQFGLTATATPWMPITDPTTGGDNCPIYTILDEAEAAARSNGYTLTSYDHEMLYFPRTSGLCPAAAGYGDEPGRITWIIGEMDTRVTVHELGHNLGLLHAHSYTCTDSNNNQVVLSDNCTQDEYADPFNAMGNGFIGQGEFAAPQKDYLGWLGARLATVTGTGSYVLSPYEAQQSATQALKVVSSGNTYWIEYRQPRGADSFMTSYPGATDGVLIHLADGGTGTRLLDETPGDAAGDSAWHGGLDAALPAGTSWTTPDGLRIAVNSATSSGASVTVTFPVQGKPGAPSAQFIVPSKMSADAIPTDPYSLTWAAGTCASSASYTVKQATNGGSSTTLFTGTATSATVNLTIGNLYAFSVSCGGPTSSTTFRLDGAQEGRATYTGTWKTSTFAGAWGGTAKFSTAKNASASYSCTCEAIAWVTDEDANHGSAKVYVDGTLRATVNTHTTASTNRAVVFKYGWAKDGAHTIKIVNVATKGHARVTIDGFLTRTTT
jgi:hypothetical protein